MNFRASFCDPFQPEVLEMGNIEKDKIMETFEKIPWKELLNKMDAADQNDIHYSPSLEIENEDNKNGLSVSAVDQEEWYIFFKRPKMVKKFFGLVEKMDHSYLSEVTGQTIDDVRTCLEALIENDLTFLEQKIK
ncbi:MAG: hypothetical protein AAFO69_09790 [Bacteroidota bacterium]